MDYSNINLKEIEEILDECSYSLMTIWFDLPSHSLVKEVSDFDQIYYNYPDSALVDIEVVLGRISEKKLKEQIDILTRRDYDKFKYEVYYNLSSFKKEKQENFYYLILIDFFERLNHFESLIKQGHNSYFRLTPHLEQYRELPVEDKILALNYIYDNALEAVQCLKFTLGPVLAPYLEEGSKDLLDIKEDLRGYVPARAKLLFRELPQPTEQEAKKSIETFTKDQVLLLSELGIFDIPAIKNLTMENKGKLFAQLLNRNEKNVTECIRNCDPKGNRQAEDNPYIYEKKVALVNKLLTEVGFYKKL